MKLELGKCQETLKNFRDQRKEANREDGINESENIRLLMKERWSTPLEWL